MISTILFILLLTISVGLFVQNSKKLLRNIRLGQSVQILGTRSERFRRMLWLAFGQGKMTIRPIAGILHIVVYFGFLVVNLEMIEIILDGIIGTHRIFKFFGGFYTFLITSFEILALLVIISVTILWIRRNLLKISRFQKKELRGFAQKDANIILYFEAILMGLFLLMNASDLQLQQLGIYPTIGKFPISQYVSFLFTNMSPKVIFLIERACWWLHIIGVCVFLNYLYYSKHLHILLAFPYTFFTSIKPKGQLDNLESVTKEVKLMLDPTVNPFEQSVDNEQLPAKFGASDAIDLSWVQILGAYTCTECGRCTDECPANMTGKLLSPRKIMMDTRDRIEEIAKNIDKNGSFVPDGKQLLNDYITPEELWACTTCNACVEACPIELNPLSIIMDMRRYLVMEKSAAPAPLNTMMICLENNVAPWAYNPSDRMKVFDE
ncbi:(Fe-S)-binding protein [Capnocytophaga catalasegens]|uniref:Fe-S oxidoreductase n=1 Tax=Capnocytophaga catalasegens TaxID=1004260 RepID=A0AAV5AWQ7_9FLAO|nr:(Fe-S)-binding protein [Capnocytophaga catalasegens]GIZ16450.1 Fe-S oxidoreductase [Capnocytophaga catalasegens]GJM50311.1 Fe-S oxidoreductase [Capnocytophaga catalasegens]GJM53828.1 Fe-S oxidoreductase [Capnocytophaga catalasegens]